MTAPGAVQGILNPFGVGTAVYYWLAAVATFMFMTALLTRDRVNLKNTALISGVLAVFAIMAELAELGNPTNVTLIFSNLASPIAIDAIGAGLFIVGTIAVYLFHRNKTALYLFSSLAAAGAVIWLIGRALLFGASPGRPLWNQAPTLLLITSVVLGIAAFLLVGYMRGKSNLEALFHIKAAFLALLLFSYGWLIALASMPMSVSAWAGLILSIVVPMALYLVYAATKIRTLIPLTALLVLIGGLFLHLYLFDLGVRVPLPGEILSK